MLQRLIKQDSPSKSSDRSALYVDVDNLRDGAQTVIEDLIRNWPSSIPTAGRLCLYVRAENLDLWEMWAKSQFPELAVVVKGVQHYSFHPSKNAADMSIAMDALSDMMLRRANWVVVFSDDSDFIGLYAKVKEIHEESGGDGRNAPFTWVLTDRRDTRSGTIRDYFPNDHVYTIKFPTGRRMSPAPAPTARSSQGTARTPARTSQAAPRPSRAAQPASRTARTPQPASRTARTPQPAPRPARAAQPASRPARSAEASPTECKHRGRSKADDDRRNGRILSQMAETILREVPVGFFGSGDCQKIVKKIWPDHSLARSSPSGFGTKFANSILPILKEKGVTEPNPNRRPRRYEMTEDAKGAAARQGSS